MTPAQYTPTNPPADPSQLGAWALQELMTLSRHLTGAQDLLTMRPQSVAPAKPAAGMVANANGTTWNPGGGAGLYQYLGGAWVKL